MYTELQPQKILVVHPEQEVREKVRAELEKKGYFVSTAANGLDGMFTGFYEKFALVITGMKLPKVTGFEMMRALQVRSYNNDTPAIFIGTEEENAEVVALAAKLNAIIMPLSAVTNSIAEADESEDNYSRVEKPLHRLISDLVTRRR